MSYPRQLEKFTKEGFTSVATEDSENGPCRMIADIDVDADGSSGNLYHDPDFQSDTTLHYEGKALNTDVDKWAVLPPELIDSVKGEVLGCIGKATNLLNGQNSPFVVGDVGPKYKNGEGSRALNKALGINPDPNHGGMDGAHILYQWTPGVAALIDGRQYTLQHHK